MGSANGRQAHPDQAYHYLKRTNEIDQINLMKFDLTSVIEDDNTPAEIRRQARLQHQLIDLKPI
jgi:hypothetical protein